MMTDADVGSHMVYSIKNQEVVEVQCVTLDSIIQHEDSEFAITKIDVEGMELKVLKGSLTAIIQGKLPVILFETNGLNKRYGISEGQICQFLSQNNYLLGNYDADNKVFTIDNKIKEDNYAIKGDRIDELEKRIKGVKIRGV